MDKRKKLVEELLRRNRGGYTWRDLAYIYEVSGATLWKLAHDKNYYPKDITILKKLGLPVISSVECLSGEVPAGSLVLTHRYCKKCHRPFIPNHWSRLNCYICVPYRPSSKRS